MGVLAFLLSLSLGGCDALYRALHKEGAEEKKLVGTVDLYEPNEKAAEVQKLLKLFGYSVGPADGVLGVNTRNAIEAFQKNNHLNPSRFVDKATWAQLNVFSEYGLVVKGELNIIAIQQVLKAAGCYSGKLDGARGRRTEEAIREFQRVKGLRVDGKVGYRTLRLLSDYIALEATKQTATVQAH